MHGEVVDKYNKTDTTNLRVIDTIGYGSIGYLENEGVVGGEDNEVMADSEVAYVPVIRKIDIQGKITKNLYGSQREFTTYDAWAEIVNLMESSTTAKTGTLYKFFDNNCCTVAYNVLVNIFGGDINKVDELIKPSEFNMNGLGIKWGNYMSSIYDPTRNLFRYVLKGNLKDNIVKTYRWSMSSS